MKNNIFGCNICLCQDPIFILNCGCILCQDCFEVAKSFNECDKVVCHSCEKEIMISETININNRNFINQISKCNTQENNIKILNNLKVS